MPTKQTQLQAVPSNEVAAPAVFTDSLKIALYGKFGSRKTQQVEYLIEQVGPDNVLILSAERGLGTIRSSVPEGRVIVVNSLQEIRDAWLPKIKPFCQLDRWLVVDGMSQVTEWIANGHLGGAERYYEAKQLGREPNTDDLKYGKYIQRGEINTMAVYGKVGRDSELLISEFIKLPVNLYCNYLEDMTGTNGFDKTVPWGPDVPGKVGLKAVMSSFDFVGRLYYNEQNKLCAGFDATSGFYMARTREDQKVVQIPKLIVDFNLGEFVKMVRGEKAAASETVS